MTTLQLVQWFQSVENWTPYVLFGGFALFVIVALFTIIYLWRFYGQ